MKTNSKNSNSNNNSNLKEVSVKNSTTLFLTSSPELEKAHAARKTAEIKAWYAANEHLLEAEVENEVISFDDAETIRAEVYDADSLRRTKRQSVNVEVEEETLSITDENMFSLFEVDEDDIYDAGGMEATVSRQVRASILTGNVDGITKRSSVYEDGGDINTVRPTELTHLMVNDNLFIAMSQESTAVEAEKRYVSALVSNMKQVTDARRAKELEVIAYAQECYQQLADKGEYIHESYKVVREMINEKFGSEYIYKYCRVQTYNFKGTMESYFHTRMHAKYLAPLRQQKGRDAYLVIQSVLDTIPAKSEAHLAYIIANESTFDKNLVKLALDYAWDNRANGKEFSKPIYFALKKHVA
jgi:hypothetical protein